MTAGNSTALTDGAALVLLAQEEWARKHNWPMLAASWTPRWPRPTSPPERRTVAGADEGHPVLLERNGLTLDD